MRSGGFVVCGLIAFACACGRQNFNDKNDGGGTDSPSGTDGGAGSANRVFVTDGLFSGNLGGLAGADAKCQHEADEAGLDGTFIAVLNDGSANSYARLAGSRGWVRTDGKPVADRVSQLINFAGWYPISTNALGTSITNATPDVWTGQMSNGTPQDGENCRGWTYDTDIQVGGGRGDLTGGGARGIDINIADCTSTSHLYCFETGHDTVVLPPAPMPGRLAFLSKTLWVPTGGRAVADAICQGEADAASKDGTFLAVLPTATAPSMDRFPTSGATWVRADGVPITDTAAAFFTTLTANTHLALDIDGGVTRATQVWGGPADVVQPMSCADWTSGAVGTSGYINDTDSVIRFVRFGKDPRPCNQATALLCLER